MPSARSVARVRRSDRTFATMPAALEDALPVDLLRKVLHALDARGMMRMAACSRGLEALSNEVAQECCRTVQKGLWCQGMSWRAQLSAEHDGRVFRSSTRVLRQHGSAGTRRSTSARMLNKPVAVAVLPEGLVAVCNFGSRSVSVVCVETGQLIQRFGVDGIPSGIALLVPADATQVTVAICVQGTAENGESCSARPKAWS